MLSKVNFLDGEILYVNKPYGWTSFDAVKRTRGAILRRLHLSKIKVGHAGTLDPLATGVMILTTGKATRRIEELQAGVKEYIATIALGATTPSFDLETEIDATYPTEHITEQLVREALEKFVGRIEQVPPAYSAIKVDGERAYKYARRGDEPVLKAKVLVIDEIELLEYSQTSIIIRVVCSKGTYIRALARDIGVALNSGGHLTALQRTRVGDVTLDMCLDIPKLVDIIKEVNVEWPENYPIPQRFLLSEQENQQEK